MTPFAIRDPLVFQYPSAMSAASTMPSIRVHVEVSYRWEAPFATDTSSRSPLGSNRMPVANWFGAGRSNCCRTSPVDSSSDRDSPSLVARGEPPLIDIDVAGAASDQLDFGKDLGPLTVEFEQAGQSLARPHVQEIRWVGRHRGVDGAVNPEVGHLHVVAARAAPENETGSVRTACAHHEEAAVLAHAELGDIIRSWD